jgi:nucleoside-diphosphate-sugar epimerase
MKKRIDAVVHVAFIIPPFSELNPKLATAVNVDGTNNLVEVIEKRESKARLLFTSSVATFGYSEFDAPEVTVDTPVSAINHYAQNKIDAENIVKLSKLKWTIFKLSAVMIPDAEITEESKEYSKSIHPKSRIEPVHVQDIATAVFNALSTNETIFGEYIIAGGKNNQTTYGEYITQTLNCFVPLKYDDIPWDKFDPEKYYLHIYDTKHSQDALHYQTRSIEQYLKEFKKNVPLWQRIFAIFMKKRVINETFHLKNGENTS